MMDSRLKDYHYGGSILGKYIPPTILPKALTNVISRGGVRNCSLLLPKESYIEICLQSAKDHKFVGRCDLQKDPMKLTSANH